MTSPNFASHAPSISGTPFEDLDRQVEELAAYKDEWVAMPIPERVELLHRCIERTAAIGEDWVAAACRAKGIDPGGPRSAEEWFGGPVTTLRNLRLIAEALEAGGQPAFKSITRRADGQYVARVFPDSGYDKVLFSGFTADVWIEPGEEPTQGKIYRDKMEARRRGLPLPAGKVSLVLGAGNVASIGPMDALYKLFAEDEVVIVKTNPVNAYLQPYWEESLGPLIACGALRICRGGAEVGSHLVHHELVDTIHMTGSDRTHDAIVWGGDPDEQKRRKASGEPLLNKPITSELGCVTPVLVVPGPWTDGDIRYHARQVASMVANNGSFNCNAAKVLAIGDRWPQRQSFLAEVERQLRETPPRRAYYPGAHDRYDRFLSRYPDARPLGPRSDTVVPWTIIPEVPPNAGEYALTSEAFCGVLAYSRLKAGDAASFLDAMVEFANDVCWGSLSCMVLVHPKTMSQHRAKFDAAIAALEYGGIAINVWAGLIYGLTSPTWGAYPGHPLHDIRSGRGVVHNTSLFDHPQKSVVTAPFRIPGPTPAWFTDNKAGHKIGPALARFEAKPGLGTLPGVLAAAMRG